jgi:hypothetical protein
MIEFADSIVEGRPPLTDGWAGLRVLAMLEAASLSLAKDGISVPISGIGDAPSAYLGREPDPLADDLPIEQSRRGRGEVTV